MRSKEKRNKSNTLYSLTPFWGSTSVSHSWLVNILVLVTPSSEMQSNLCSESWNISFPSFTDLGVGSKVSPIFPHFVLPDSVFYCRWCFLPLSIFSARCHLLGGRAQLCPEVGGLERDGTSCIQPQLLLTEVTLQPPPPVPGHLHPILININPHPIYISNEEKKGGEQ